MFASTSSNQADHLASAALLAATELDKLERGRAADANAIHRFLDLLANSSGVEPSPDAPPLSLDPLGSEMFSAAVSHIISKRPIDIPELHRELARMLRQWRLDTTQDKTLKNFCLAIHDFVLRNRTVAALNERGVFDYDHTFSE